MSILAQLLWVWLGAAVLMLLAFEIQRRRSDASLVDACWAFGIAAGAVFVALTATGDPLNAVLAGNCGGLWGLRLGAHLVRDRLIGKPEDGRYQAMRAAMGQRAQLGFFAFFQAQALLIALFTAPFALAAANPSWSLPASCACLGLWLISILGETIADAQLARFRADPATRGTTCRVGLWRWSRHPNYFFEWLHWWGIAILAATAPAWWGFLGFVFPPLMLIFLLVLTGIPYTEARALRTRRDYADYQRTTSAFIPWPPKSWPLPPAPTQKAP